MFCPRSDLYFSQNIELRRSTKNIFLKVLTLVGCWSTGIIYTSIGVIAILSFLKLKQGGADESSFFVLLNAFFVGRVINWIIILGGVCFVVWRFYEAFQDPYKVGNDKSGILLRTGAAFSSFADAFIAFTALQAIFSENKAPVTGEPVQQRSLVGELLQSAFGHVVIYATGIVVLLTALVLVMYGLSKRFTEALNGEDFSKGQRAVVHGIAYAGYFSRGVILGIVGFFFLKAAIKNNSSYVVNTDKAFDFIGDHVGHTYFILIAIGTICYGIYMFILGLYYQRRAKK